MWSRSGEHGRLGSLKVVSVLRVLGPSLFGYTMLSVSEKKLSGMCNSSNVRKLGQIF